MYLPDLLAVRFGACLMERDAFISLLVHRFDLDAFLAGEEEKVQ